MSNFKYSFEIISDENRGAVYHLNRVTMVIGSNAGSDIVLENNGISENHCFLKQIQDTLTISDMHSGVGTKVGSKMIDSETVLKSGDILTIGSVKLRVSSDTFKEKITPPSPIKKLKGKSLLKKLSGAFKSDKKSTYKKATLISMLLMVIFSWIIIVYPLYSSFNTQLNTSKIERGTALLKTLAAANIRAMKLGNQSMVDISMVSQELGVGMALVMTNKGSVWAPKSLLDKTATDTYGKKATSTEKLLIQKRTDGKLDFAIPINYYDFKQGVLTKVGVARIIFDLKSTGTSGKMNWFVLLLLTSCAYLAIATFLAIRIIKTVTQDIEQYREDCEEFIRNEGDVLTEMHSPELNELTVTINRMLRKIELPESVSGGKLGLVSKAILLDLIDSLDQGALLLDKTNNVLGNNKRSLEILGLDADHVENKSLLEIQCPKVFYKELLEFISKASLIDSKEQDTIQLSENEKMECVSIPMGENLILLLLSLSK